MYALVVCPVEIAKFKSDRTNFLADLVGLIRLQPTLAGVSTSISEA